MDELSKFKFAPAHLLELEQELIDQADIVFTGGSSLYEAKKDRHPNVHCFPSSVDRAHFAKARARQFDPADQEDLPRPRLGFYGVIDERFDTELLDKVAEMRPDWSFVMVGPVVKIARGRLPQRPNIHYLGAQDLRRAAGLSVGLGRRADAVRDERIDPVHLADQDPRISRRRKAGGVDPDPDVVRHYGQLEGVQDRGRRRKSFVAACDEALELSRNPESGWLAEADLMLSATSWDTTQARMAGLVADLLGTRAATAHPGAARGGGMSAPSAPAQRRAYDYLIVGAGFAGSVLAERLASQHGARVLLIDRRPHIGGNAYDEPNEAGILYHKYGPHIFHTNSDQVVDYLSQFTEWRPYEHRVLARWCAASWCRSRSTARRSTCCSTLDLKTDEDAADYLASRAEPVEDIQTSEDVVINAVGRELYELFFRGYTRKQWGLDPTRARQVR